MQFNLHMSEKNSTFVPDFVNCRATCDQIKQEHLKHLYYVKTEY